MLSVYLFPHIYVYFGKFVSTYISVVVCSVGVAGEVHAEQDVRGLVPAGPHAETRRGR